MSSEYFNYKHFHSIVLFALVDENYDFIYANLECRSRISDGEVFAETHLKKSLDDNTVSFFSPHAIPETNEQLPFVLLGDDAFCLTLHVMKPFPEEHIRGIKLAVFSYRLS